MKIVVDDKIPYIHETISQLADETVFLSGAAITADDVRDADVLVVRTRTRCNRELLEGSKVQLVVTATIGYDHIDTQWLEEAGIRWTNCPGCNSGSVAQYVECALLLLEKQKGLSLHQSTIGIVGCGHVGSKVKAAAERLGMKVLICDPPLGHPEYVSLDEIEKRCDVITFHVPLIREEHHACHTTTCKSENVTWHMADEEFFHYLPRVPYIINTSRGEVVDNKALLKALEDGRVRDAVIDVWENEPYPDATLLGKVFIGTPHIAGYSADGKVNADNMVIDAICQHFGLPHPGNITPPALPNDFHYTGSPLDLYNPMDDSKKLKADSSQFEQLRNNYPLRREKKN